MQYNIVNIMIIADDEWRRTIRAGTLQTAAGFV